MICRSAPCQIGCCVDSGRSSHSPAAFATAYRKPSLQRFGHPFVEGIPVCMLQKASQAISVICLADCWGVGGNVAGSVNSRRPAC